MKATSLQTRLISLLFAAIASATVLGATVAGMQPGAPAHDVVVMEHVTVKPTAVQ